MDGIISRGRNCRFLPAQLAFWGKSSKRAADPGFEDVCERNTKVSGFTPSASGLHSENVMHSQGIAEHQNYRDLMMRLSTVLAMTELAYVEAERRRG